MADTVAERIAELEAFEPSDDAVDNDERLQIWVDRWAETPDKEAALEAMFGIFERHPELSTLGEPGPLVHAIEQVPGYENALAASLDRSPSYYGVWMVNRILEGDLSAEAREAYLNLLRGVSASESAPPSVRGEAAQFLAFREG